MCLDYVQDGFRRDMESGSHGRSSSPAADHPLAEYGEYGEPGPSDAIAATDREEGGNSARDARASDLSDGPLLLSVAVPDAAAAAADEDEADTQDGGRPAERLESPFRSNWDERAAAVGFPLTHVMGRHSLERRLHLLPYPGLIDDSCRVVLMETTSFCSFLSGFLAACALLRSMYGLTVFAG